MAIYIILIIKLLIRYKRRIIYVLYEFLVILDDLNKNIEFILICQKIRRNYAATVAGSTTPHGYAITR